jgi:hypothetical protein
VKKEEDESKTDSRERVRAATRCFGDPARVEFGSSDGAYAKAFISDQSIIRSVRSDIRDYLDPDQGELLSVSATGLLMAVMDPSRLFEFSALVDLFARELVPCQVLYRQEAGVTYFSPLRLRRFGLA